MGDFSYYLSMKFLILILGSVTSFLLLKYRGAIKMFTGDFSWAEKYLGSGGTNTFIVLFAIGVFILSLMYSLGTLDSFISNSLGVLF